MRILVTGERGQVARALAEVGPGRGHAILARRRPKLDLERPETVMETIAATRPDAVVSAAAYTHVDLAETDAETAFRVNEGGARAVARASAALGIPLVHLSTDYVFSGEAHRPHREDDPIGPKGVYGASKAASEAAVRDEAPNHAILRTSWLYSPFGRNFARTILRLAGARDELRIVADQHGSPTCTLDLAEGIVTIVENLAASDDTALRGTFHVSSEGDATWAGFAEAILAESATRGGPTGRVTPISTQEFGAAAPRPANSRLDCRKARDAHGVSLPHWRAPVGATVQRLLDEPETFA